MTHPIISTFINELLAITANDLDEQEIVSRVAPLAQRVAINPDWRTEDMSIADPDLGFGSTLLHSEPDNSLFVVVDSWLPGRGVRPHDHGTWAVVASMTGPEHNVFWERLDDGSREGHAELRRLGEEVVSPGEVVSMRSGEIHSVENRTDETTLSLHIYGRHLNHTGRSQFDVENNREIPFIIETR